MLLSSLPSLYKALSILSLFATTVPSTVRAGGIYPSQPNPFTGVAINAAGDFAAACTGTQWFFRNGDSTTAWELGEAQELSGMVDIGISDDDTVLTFAGTDGFRSYYSAGSFSTLLASGTPALPAAVTISSSNVNSLSVSGTGSSAYQIMGTLDGGLWVSTVGTTDSFVKYVRVGANAGAGELLNPIGAVSTFGSTQMGALSVLYQYGYNFASTQFNKIASTPTDGTKLTSMAITSDTWYATFRSAADGSVCAVQKSVSDAAWEDVGNNTVFPTAQHVATAGNAGEYVVVCANDQVMVSADSGATFQAVEPFFDNATGSWSPYIPDTPLKAAISHPSGAEIVFITRLSLYSATCSYEVSGEISCLWTVVSIMTSTATYLSKDGDDFSISNGNVHFSNGAVGFDVKLLAEQ